MDEAATLREVLARTPVLAILRARTATHFVAAARRLAGAGFTAVEFTLTTDGALEALRELRASQPDLHAGIGTVITPDDAAAAVDAGAQFLVAPCVRVETLDEARQLGVPMIAGAFTATEVVTAVEHGSPLVKLFPSVLGPAYLKALRGPLPNVAFVPTGGVALDSIPAYLEAGAAAVGLGSPLTGDSLDTGDVDAMAIRATQAVDAAMSARAKSNEISAEGVRGVVAPPSAANGAGDAAMSARAKSNEISAEGVRGVVAPPSAANGAGDAAMSARAKSWDPDSGDGSRR